MTKICSGTSSSLMVNLQNSFVLEAKKCICQTFWCCHCIKFSSFIHFAINVDMVQELILIQTEDYVIIKVKRVWKERGGWEQRLKVKNSFCCGKSIILPGSVTQLLIHTFIFYVYVQWKRDSWCIQVHSFLRLIFFLSILVYMQTVSKILLISLWRYRSACSAESLPPIGLCRKAHKHVKDSLLIYTTGFAFTCIPLSLPCYSDAHIQIFISGGHILSATEICHILAGCFYTI